MELQTLAAVAAVVEELEDHHHLEDQADLES
jgi:hypothetical protein